MESKTIILKQSETLYRVNGKEVYYSQTAGWQYKQQLTIKEMYDFHKFLQYGKLGKQTLADKLSRLEIEKTRLIEKYKQIVTTNKNDLRASVYEAKLSAVLAKIADYKYNVIVYQRQ
jgi:hypothetical protein